MKKATLVWTIIGMVVTIGMCLVNIVNALETGYGILSVLYLVSLGLCITFGVLSILSINRNEKKIWLGVCSLLFCGLIGGILYLCWQPPSNNPVTKETTSEKTTYSPSDYDAPEVKDVKEEPIEVIAKLKKLYEDGVITKEEYEEKRKVYVDML